MEIVTRRQSLENKVSVGMESILEQKFSELLAELELLYQDVFNKGYENLSYAVLSIIIMIKTTKDVNFIILSLFTCDNASEILKEFNHYVELSVTDCVAKHKIRTISRKIIEISKIGSYSLSAFREKLYHYADFKKID